MSLVLVLFSCGVVLAGDSAADARISARGAFAANADFQDRDGGFSEVRAGASVSCGIVTLAWGLRSYDWDDPADLPFGNGVDDPWDELHAVDLLAADHGRMGERWGWYWLAGVGAAYEEEMNDSFYVSLGGGLSRALGRDWMLRFGALGAGHKVNWNLLPTASVLWRQGAEQGFSARLGAPGSELAYRFNPYWSLRLGAEMDLRVWRLADDSTVQSEGYVREMGIRSGLYAKWTPTPELKVGFGPEMTFARRITLYNDDGEQRNSYGADAAPGFSVRLGYEF